MFGRIIFNADDFGISRGVNQAIIRAHNEGILNSASLMVNQKYAKEAVVATAAMPNLELGLHLNLTNESCAAPATEIPLLVDADGKFKNGFVKLLLLSLFKHKQLQEQVRREAEAQILKARAMGAKLQHIDSHRHVHLIPAVFEVVAVLAQKYQLGRIRIMNECGMLTATHTRGLGWLFDGGAVKYFLLRFFSFISGYASKTYFYTMLFTCKLSKEKFADVVVPQGYDSVEIMIHPGMPEVDQNYPEDIFDANLLSPWRGAELETLLDKKVLDGFRFNGRYPWPIALYDRLENWWFRLNQKLRFLLVGGFNTVFAYGVYAFLLVLVGLPYLWALVVQYFITINVSILTMRYYVFRSFGNFWREFGKAWAVYVGMFGFNSIFLSFLVEICGIGELPAQAVYLVVSTIITYLLHKYFSFCKKVK